MNKRTIQLSVVATSVVVAATLALTTLLVNDENPTQSTQGRPSAASRPRPETPPRRLKLKAPARRRSSRSRSCTPLP